MINREIIKQEQRIYTEQEKLRAAYALNMCTVSVSQIVEYNDSYILDQEYDAILNNLNLEQMPKDESLLTILTELLNVITFFKIQNIRKEMIEKDYQDKMKNAIWSAVPNIGMIVAGGNLITAGISLATQVGMGYMNYRKEKANANQEKYKQEMELQITAIEQFNALKRELFTTAWRLATEYNFPDQYRLTERQITQYNSILLDQNEQRKYDRLDSIQANFLAYPPFWYHFGHTAAYIAGNPDLKISDQTRAYYRTKAKEYFKKYQELNKFNILREDQLTASFALEYIDLLLLEESPNQSDIAKLLDLAVKHAGTSNDILELCAISYLKIGEVHKAADLLKYLVNEEYNTLMNAKLLSSVCVSQYIIPSRYNCKYGVECKLIEECALREFPDNSEVNRQKYKAMYETLASRVNEKFLLPMPTQEFDRTELSDEEILEQLADDFMQQQKVNLKENYLIAFKQFVKKCKIEFNKVLPLPVVNHCETDNYYADNRNARYQRRKDVGQALQDNHYRQDYIVRLKQIGFKFRYIDVINKSLDAFDMLIIFSDCADKQLVRQKANQLAKKMTDIQQKLDTDQFRFEDYKRLQNELSYDCFMGQYIDRLRDGILNKIDTFENMKVLDDAELLLTEFCLAQKIDLYQAQRYSERKDVYRKKKEQYLGYDIFGKEAEIEEARQEQFDRMKQLIIDQARNLKKEKSHTVAVLITGTDDFEAYFKNANLSSKLQKENAVAIIQDKTNKAYDLVLGNIGYALLKKGKIQKTGKYKDVKYSIKRGKEMLEFTNVINGIKYHHNGINIGKLKNLMDTLNDLIEEYKE